MREASVLRPEVEEVIKPKRKRTNKEKIITSAFILIAAVACIYYGKIPGKHGGFSMDNDPFFFWVTLCVFRFVRSAVPVSSGHLIFSS
jgi:hypothetical protein